VGSVGSKSASAAAKESPNSRRVAARILDGLLLLGLTILLTHLLEGSTWVAVSLWLTVTYFFLCEALFGQTLGKAALGLAVLSRQGQPPATNQIAVRNVIRVFEEPFIALAVLFGSRRRQQRLGDFAARTSVGPEGGARRPTRSPLLIVYPLVWAGLGALLLTLPNRAVPPHFHIAGPDQGKAAYLADLQAICRERDHWIRTHPSQPWRAITRYELSYTRRYASLSAPPSLGWVHDRILAGRRRLDRATLWMERMELRSHHPVRLFENVVQPRMRRVAGASNMQFVRAGIACSTPSHD
jgi:uncharacterized RDD family membrane protein YckC